MCGLRENKLDFLHPHQNKKEKSIISKDTEKNLTKYFYVIERKLYAIH